jgi:SEC-C motif-containing protein
MARISPNDPCPCGLGIKFKKCCALYLDGRESENAERLLRVRHAAQVIQNNKFLWESMHPQAPRRLKDYWSHFEHEQKLLKDLDYKSLKIVDLREGKPDEVRIVQYVTVWEGEHDLSYIEESLFRLFEGRWFYVDGLRRSSLRIGCVPETVKVGELATFYLHGSSHN